MPGAFPSYTTADARPVEELVLTLTDPTIETEEGKRRAVATATLAYAPAASGSRRIESRRYTFTAPLGPIEKDDLRWYLESYFLWPVGVFKDRAEGIERKLPDWGRDLFRAALGAEEAREAFFAWQHTAETAERRFSVLVDDDPPDRAEAATGTTTSEAAAELLALPWELLHDSRTWLFQGGHAVRVRRRLPNRYPQPARPTALCAFVPRRRMRPLWAPARSPGFQSGGKATPISVGSGHRYGRGRTGPCPPYTVGIPPARPYRRP